MYIGANQIMFEHNNEEMTDSQNNKQNGQLAILQINLNI